MGIPYLVVNGFKFQKMDSKGTTVYWRCVSMSSDLCPVSALTDSESFMNLMGMHNHPVPIMVNPENVPMIKLQNKISTVPVEVVPKNKVWHYFKKETRNHAKCNLCQLLVKFKPNTEEMKLHLKTMHGVVVR
jgi:hypothetical protein